MTMQAHGDTAQIDWYLDDGVNIPMLNDILRNRFYNRILSTDIAGANCVDIGFGTGLLSLLALEHGAAHVTAFEQDPNRYQLGQEIIHELGLQNQIKLHLGRFSHEQLADHVGQVIMTETVNDTIFQEGLWHILPRIAGHDFRPGQYFLNLHLIPIAPEVAQWLGAESQDPKPFCPGVPIRQDFVAAVNRHRDRGCSLPAQPVQPMNLEPGINCFDHRMDTVWNWTPHMLLARDSTATAGFVIDAESSTVQVWNSQHQESQPIDFDCDTVSVTVPLQPHTDKTFLLVPRFGLQHGKHQLLLDTGHWGPCPAVILHECMGSVTVQQNIFSGEVAYHV